MYIQWHDAQFEWDPRKAGANARKHSVDFADAVAVFFDERAVTIVDDHPHEERILGARSRGSRAQGLRGGWMKKEARDYDFSRGRRGAVLETPGGKTRITIRLDDEIVAWFRRRAHAAGGGNYQTMINQALREHVADAREPLEAVLRRVVREELRRRRAG